VVAIQDQSATDTFTSFVTSSQTGNFYTREKRQKNLQTVVQNYSFLYGFAKKRSPA